MAKTVKKQDEVISTLNHLIETCRDGQNGFREAAENIEDPRIKQFCLEQSAERNRFVVELQQEVRALGGDPEAEGSATAAMHRAWIDLKSTFGGGDGAIIAACETGEDHAVEQYEEALKTGLPANVRSTIERQYQNVKQAHDRVKVLRDNLNK